VVQLMCFHASLLQGDADKLRIIVFCKLCVCVCVCVCVCISFCFEQGDQSVVWGLICVLCLKASLVVYQLTYHGSLVPSLLLSVSVAYFDSIVNSSLHIVCRCLQVADGSCNLVLTQYYIYQEITN